MTDIGDMIERGSDGPEWAQHRHDAAWREITDQAKALAENAALRAEVERLREERRWRTFPANLPDANGRYVCMWADGDMYIQRWNGSKWLGAFDHEITHWMPLPEPPMEE